MNVFRFFQQRLQIRQNAQKESTVCFYWLSRDHSYDRERIKTGQNFSDIRKGIPFANRYPITNGIFPNARPFTLRENGLPQSIVSDFSTGLGIWMSNDKGY